MIVKEVGVQFCGKSKKLDGVRLGYLALNRLFFKIKKLYLFSLKIRNFWPTLAQHFDERFLEQGVLNIRSNSEPNQP